MRTRLLLPALLLCAAPLRAQEVLLLLDGLDPQVVGAEDVDGRPLAPWLTRFRDASDGGIARAASVGTDECALAFGRPALEQLRATVAPARTLLSPEQALDRLRAGVDGPVLIHVPDDPKRAADPELLLRCDPTPWAGAATARDHEQQRRRRLQRAEATWSLRAAGRPPREGAREVEVEWFARVRVAELEARLAPLLEFLLGEECSASVLLGAVHGARSHADDLSPRARRVPAFRLRETAPTPQAGAHWTLQLPLRPRESRFARESQSECLRIENGRILLFDLPLDPEERFDRARVQPIRVREVLEDARREVFGGDEATLALEISTSAERLLLVGPLPAERVIMADDVEVSTRGEMLALRLAPGSSTRISLRLRAEDEGLRVMGDLQGLSVRVGDSNWSTGRQLDLDLRSGALLAALQNATGAPQGPGDRLLMRIEPSAQRPDEAE